MDQRDNASGCKDDMIKAPEVLAQKTIEPICCAQNLDRHLPLPEDYFAASVLRGLPLGRFTGCAAVIALGGRPRRRGAGGKLPAKASGNGAEAFGCADIALISVADAANQPAANPSR
jgi:hypothetical protein